MSLTGEEILVFAGDSAHRFAQIGPAAGGEWRDEPPGRLTSPMPGRLRDERRCWKARCGTISRGEGLLAKNGSNLMKQELAST